MRNAHLKLSLGRGLPLAKWPVLLFAVLLLTSCIDVDDYGAMWEKTTVDPALQGRWAKISEDNPNKTTGQEWTFTLKDGAYEIQGYAHGQTDNDPLYPAKTLKIGPYLFLGNGPDKGTIVRYEVDRDISMWFVIKPQPAWAFIAKNFPSQEVIYRDDPDESESKQANDDRPLRISYFDDETAKILASIPDTEAFWDPDTRLKKIK